jgi:hypothetical protein
LRGRDLGHEKRREYRRQGDITARRYYVEMRVPAKVLSIRSQASRRTQAVSVPENLLVPNENGLIADKYEHWSHITV